MSIIKTVSNVNKYIEWRGEISSLTQYLDGQPAYGEEYHNGGKHFNYLSQENKRSGINHIQPVRVMGLVCKKELLDIFSCILTWSNANQGGVGGQGFLKCIQRVIFLSGRHTRALVIILGTSTQLTIIVWY